MATAEGKRYGVPELTKRMLAHCLGVGGASAIILYSQSWYAETLRDRPELLVLGLVIWLVVNDGEFNMPIDLSARA